MANKTELRKQYKKIRELITPKEGEENSIEICRKLFRDTDWSKIKKICTYSPIPKLNEVDINPLLQTVAYKYPDIKITLLSQSKSQKIPQTKYDLIIIPCLAFDKDKYRLGWGGGFYDRFLAKQPQAMKIGVCFYIGFVKGGLPREPHDIPLDKVITEV